MINQHDNDSILNINLNNTDHPMRLCVQDDMRLKKLIGYIHI